MWYTVTTRIMVTAPGSCWGWLIGLPGRDPAKRLTPGQQTSSRRSHRRFAKYSAIATLGLGCTMRRMYPRIWPVLPRGSIPAVGIVSSESIDAWHRTAKNTGPRRKPGHAENLQLVVLTGYSASSQEEVWLSPVEGIVHVQGLRGKTRPRDTLLSGGLSILRTHFFVEW